MITIKTDRLILKTNCTVANGCIIFPEQPHSMSLFELTPAKAEDSGFAIYLKSDDVLVGHIAFDFKRSRFELSVGIKEQFQKHGYMTEAQKAVVDWLFENTNHDKIWALLGGITNEASRKILERTGFRKEQEGNLEWWVIEREYYKMNQKMEWIKECFPDYDVLVEYDDIDNKSKKREIHGLNSHNDCVCMFCGTPYEKWRKKDEVHAISECTGNKSLITYTECYDCNHLFGEIAENHLGKFFMPYRIINEVYGKGKYHNTVKDNPIDDSLSYGTYRFEQKKNAPIFESETFDVRTLLIESHDAGHLIKTENGYLVKIPRQKYDYLMIYPSLLKLAFSILPTENVSSYKKQIRGLFKNCLVKSGVEKGKVPCSEEILDELNSYFLGLPNIALEIKIVNKAIPNHVNACLLQNKECGDGKPNLLFALQMRWYSIVIPLINDDEGGGNYNLKYIQTSGTEIRKLDLREIEDEVACYIKGDEIPIPEELIPELEEDLRKAKLLRRQD